MGLKAGLDNTDPMVGETFKVTSYFNRKHETNVIAFEIFSFLHKELFPSIRFFSSLQLFSFSSLAHESRMLDLPVDQ